MRITVFRSVCALALVAALVEPVWTRPSAQHGAGAVNEPALPADYVIGAEDILFVSFWDEKEMSADVIVRPDGKITLPLLKDVQAAGLTPRGLGVELEKVAARYLEAANINVTVSVKEVRSRKIYILGEVARPGTYPLNLEMNVLQAIAAAGGLREWADKDKIEVVRTENSVETRHKFNYSEAIKGKNPKQNITLRPGDLIVVP